MAVIPLRLNLKELYEDIIDKRIIDEYETKEKKGEVKFTNSDEIIRMIEK